MYPTESVSVYRRIYATLSDFMGSIQMCTAWEWVTLLLLLCPSCLSFAKTNKIKLNCLKIAKNETKCRKGAPQANGYEATKLTVWAWNGISLSP